MPSYERCEYCGQHFDIFSRSFCCLEIENFHGNRNLVKRVYCAECGYEMVMNNKVGMYYCNNPQCSKDGNLISVYNRVEALIYSRGDNQ